MDNELDEREELAEQLLKIANELNARELSCNLIYKEFNSVSWNDLCDMAIDIINKIK